jgi:hypothetical protein
VCALSYNYKLQHATDATGGGVVSVVVALVIMALSQTAGELLDGPKRLRL